MTTKSSDNDGRLHYAVVAGSCAALGSFFGKLTSGEASSSLLSGTIFQSVSKNKLIRTNSHKIHSLKNYYFANKSK